MSRLGFNANARAKEARWRWPPEQLVRETVHVGARKLHHLKQIAHILAGV